MEDYNHHIRIQGIPHKCFLPGIVKKLGLGTGFDLDNASTCLELLHSCA